VELHALAELDIVDLEVVAQRVAFGQIRDHLVLGPLRKQAFQPEPIGDHTERCSGRMQPEQRVTLLERQLIAASPHRDPSYPDGVALRM